MITFNDKKIKDVLVKRVKHFGKDSGHISMPGRYVGKQAIVLIEKQDNTLKDLLSNAEMTSIRLTLKKALNGLECGLHYGYVKEMIEDYLKNLEDIALSDESTENLISLLQNYGGSKEIIKKIEKNV